MDYCDGCLDYQNNCPVKRNNRIGNCPCTECIVKMICDNPCDLFKDYHDRFEFHKKHGVKRITVSDL